MITQDQGSLLDLQNLSVRRSSSRGSGTSRVLRRVLSLREVGDDHDDNGDDQGDQHDDESEHDEIDGLGLSGGKEDGRSCRASRVAAGDVEGQVVEHGGCGTVDVTSSGVDADASREGGLRLAGELGSLDLTLHLKVLSGDDLKRAGGVVDLGGGVDLALGLIREEGAVDASGVDSAEIVVGAVLVGVGAIDGAGVAVLGGAGVLDDGGVETDAGEGEAGTCALVVGHAGLVILVAIESHSLAGLDLNLEGVVGLSGEDVVFEDLVVLGVLHVVDGVEDVPVHEVVGGGEGPGGGASHVALRAGGEGVRGDIFSSVVVVDELHHLADTGAGDVGGVDGVINETVGGGLVGLDGEVVQSQGPVADEGEGGVELGGGDVLVVLVVDLDSKNVDAGHEGTELDGNGVGDGDGGIVVLESRRGGVDLALGEVASVDLLAVQVGDEASAGADGDLTGGVVGDVLDGECGSVVLGGGGGGGEDVGKGGGPGDGTGVGLPVGLDLAVGVVVVPGGTERRKDVADGEGEALGALGRTEGATEDDVAVLEGDLHVAVGPAVASGIGEGEVVAVGGDALGVVGGHGSGDAGSLEDEGVGGIAELEADLLTVVVGGDGEVHKDVGRHAIVHGDGHGGGAVLAEVVRGGEGVGGDAHGFVGNAANGAGGGIELERQLERGADSEVVVDRAGRGGVSEGDADVGAENGRGHGEGRDDQRAGVLNDVGEVAHVVAVGGARGVVGVLRDVDLVGGVGLGVGGHVEAAGGASVGEIGVGDVVEELPDAVASLTVHAPVGGVQVVGDLGAGDTVLVHKLGSLGSVGEGDIKGLQVARVVAVVVVPVVVEQIATSATGTGVGGAPVSTELGGSVAEKVHEAVKVDDGGRVAVLVEDENGQLVAADIQEVHRSSDGVEVSGGRSRGGFGVESNLALRDPLSVEFVAVDDGDVTVLQLCVDGEAMITSLAVEIEGGVEQPQLVVGGNRASEGEGGELLTSVSDRSPVSRNDANSVFPVGALRKKGNLGGYVGSQLVTALDSHLSKRHCDTGIEEVDSQLGGGVPALALGLLEHELVSASVHADLVCDGGGGGVRGRSEDLVVVGVVHDEGLIGVAALVGLDERDEGLLRLIAAGDGERDLEGLSSAKIVESGNGVGGRETGGRSNGDDTSGGVDRETGSHGGSGGEVVETSGDRSDGEAVVHDAGGIGLLGVDETITDVDSSQGVHAKVREATVGGLGGLIKLELELRVGLLVGQDSEGLYLTRAPGDAGLGVQEVPVGSILRTK